MIGLREKVAQLLVVAPRGERLTGAERRAVATHRFGGFILFGANCGEPEQIAALCAELSAPDGPVCPFIAIDHEGGRVHRLPAPFTHFPPARVIGRTGNPELAYRVARAMAAELAAVGINLNFAPVLDVDSDARNPAIGDRSFSPDPREVIRFAGRFIAGLTDGGVIACGKHFPGHGDTATDSHVEMPVVGKSARALMRVELRPFAHACRARIPAMMTAHVLYPALDEHRPATLSPAIINRLRRWHADVVVFSDDLRMRALRRYPPDEIAPLALKAGVDVLLYAEEIEAAVGTLERVVAACRSDSALCARIEESYRRVCRLKRSMLKRFTAPPAAEMSRRLEGLPQTRLCEEIQGSLYAV